MSYFAPKQDEVGTIKDFGQAALPGGWLLCDGAAVSRAIYAALFAAIGVVWGAGDGATTFNVPDCRGRSRVGVGQGAGLTNRVLAASAGAEVHVLTTAEIALHDHIEQEEDSGGTPTTKVETAGVGVAGTFQPQGTNNANRPSIRTQGTGGGGSHNTMHPFKACTVGIRA